MIPEYNSKSLAIGVPGLLMQIGGAVARGVLIRSGTEVGPGLLWATVGVQLLGSVLLIIGLGYYAKAKGYSGVLGLLGLLSCIGLIILAVLPDKTR